MDGYSPCQLSPGKQPCKKSAAAAVAVAVTLGVAVVALTVTVPTVLCQQAMGSAMANTSGDLARLEKELDVTNRSLAEARWQWGQCKKELGALEGKAAELEQAHARMTQLQEENEALKAEVAQQQKQLEELQSSRDEVQLQNQLLEKQLLDTRSHHSGGKGLPGVSLSLLALVLIFPAMLLL